MPELPEVETIARKIKPDLISRKIAWADLLWVRTLETPAPEEFFKQIAGQEIKSVGRRAKYLNIQTGSYHLYFHLRMSGDLYIKEEDAAQEKHDRLVLHLQPGDKKLVFNDTRKFGRVWLVQEPEDVVGKLGPEPLDENFTAEMLFQGLQSRRRQIKPLLLDQTFIAGLGNIYTDEALHIAKLHPQTISHSVDRKQADGLIDAIRSVLREGIRRNGASIDWVYRGGEFQNYFRVYGRAGEQCPVCNTPIERLVVGQRGTHICPKCQRLGA